VNSDTQYGVLTYVFNRREEATTDTLEAAMAADAIHGFMVSPIGKNTPVA